MPNIYADFGVNNAIISGELSEHEEKMISQPVDVRDGDDSISFNVEDDPQIEVTQHEVEEPEVDRIDINTETGEVDDTEIEEAEFEEINEGEDLEFADVDPTDFEANGKEMTEAMAGQETLLQEALGKGLDASIVEVMKEEYANGGLSDTTYQALEAVGYSKTFVDSYIKGQEAVATKFAQSIMSYAGGETQFAKISDHIATNAAMTDAFNSALDRNDVATMKALIDAAKGTLRQSFGVKPQRDITKGAKPAVSSPAQNKVEAFGSRDEMVKAMSDPRYARDAKFRAEVEARVAASF